MTKDPLPERRAKLLQAARAGIACGYSRCAAKLDLESVEVMGDANAIVGQMEKAGKLESLDASLTRDHMADGLRIAEAVCREMDMRALAYGRTGDAKDVIDLPAIVAKVLGEPVPKSESVALSMENRQLRDVVNAARVLDEVQDSETKPPGWARLFMEARENLRTALHRLAKAAPAEMHRDEVCPKHGIEISRCGCGN